MFSLSGSDNESYAFIVKIKMIRALCKADDPKTECALVD